MRCRYALMLCLLLGDTFIYMVIMIILQPPHQSEPSPVLSIMKETKIDIGVLLNKKPANQEKVLSFMK